MTWRNIVNLEHLNFEKDDPQFSYEIDPRAFSKNMGASKLGWNISRIPPGEFSCPYHYSEEELFLVISGTAVLRQGGQFREVVRADRNLIGFQLESYSRPEEKNLGDDFLDRELFLPTAVLYRFSAIAKQPQSEVFPHEDATPRATSRV